MSSLNSQYLNSGDIVKVPQQTSIYTATSLKQLKVLDARYAVIVEMTKDNKFYKILLDDEYWYVDRDDVSWMGA